MFLFAYYLYVVFNVVEKLNIVVFFLCNAMLRTEMLLLKVEGWRLGLRSVVKANL
jgi:hypothetical protein